MKKLFIMALAVAMLTACEKEIMNEKAEDSVEVTTMAEVKEAVSWSKT